MSVSLFNVSGLLAKLLREHNRVSLPCIGAFIAEYKPASIINDGKTILPPTKKITFSIEEQWNDGFLENALVAQEKITIDEAKKQIAQFAQEITNLLKEGKHIEFPDFGTLYLSFNNEYVFEKNSDINLLPEAFGLPELELSSLPNNVPIIEATISTPKYTATDSTQKPKNTKHKSKTKKKRCPTCWIVVGVIVLVVAALTLRSIYVFYSSQPKIIMLPLQLPTTPLQDTMITLEQQTDTLVSCDSFKTKISFID